MGSSRVGSHLPRNHRPQNTDRSGVVGSLLDVHGIRLSQKVLMKSLAFDKLEGVVPMVAKVRVMVLMLQRGNEQTLSFEPSQIQAS
jgi:hypothetical protein